MSKATEAVEVSSVALGIRIGALHVQPFGETAGDGYIQTMVVGICVLTKLLIAKGRTAQVGGARNNVGKGVLRDGIGLAKNWTTRILHRHCDRLSWAGQHGLIGVIRFAQVRSLGAKVADLERPVPAERTFHSEVPLLHGG